MADRATYQTQVCEIIPMEEIKDGDVTAESLCDVTPERDTQEGEEESATKAKTQRSLWARYSRYVPVTLCVISLTSLIIIIALSTHLSLMTQQYGETSITLEKLQQEHEHLSSSLTFQPGEALRQTELETTRSDQLRSREEQKTISRNLARTMQEKVGTGTTMTDLKDNLWNTANTLQEKTNELTRQQLKIKVKSPSKKETKVFGTRRVLQQIQSQLQESQRNLQEQLEMLKNMEERLNELEDNLRKLEDTLSEQEERQCNQVESLGDEMRGSEMHSGTICPDGWRQIDETCYYFSSESKVRIKAEEDCKKKNATLAKIQESDSTLKAMVKTDGRSFWIGLSRVTNEWKWSDESLQEKFKFKINEWCAKASPELKSQPCATPLPWICQKPRKYRWRDGKV